MAEEMRERGKGYTCPGLGVGDDQPIEDLVQAAVNEVNSGGSIAITKNQLRRLVLHIRDLEGLAADLYDAAQHLRACRFCGEGDLNDCEGGRAALAVIARVEARGERQVKPS